MCTLIRPTQTSRRSRQFPGLLRKVTFELPKTSKVLPSETWNLAYPSGPVMMTCFTWMESPTFKAQGCESCRTETWPVNSMTLAAASEDVGKICADAGTARHNASDSAMNSTARVDTRATSTAASSAEAKLSIKYRTLK